MPFKNRIDWKNNPPSSIRVGLNINTSELEFITDGERSIPLSSKFKKFFASGADSIILVFNSSPEDYHRLEYQKVKDEVVYIQRKKQPVSGRSFTYSLKPQSS